MGDHTWNAGEHCWLDLLTPDVEGSKRFYAELLGWEYKEMPMPGGGDGVYTMATLDGGDVGGMTQTQPHHEHSGMRPSWSLYIAVDSVDETAERAREAGGGVMMEPFDIPDTGRMAMITGATGEVFGVWKRSSAHKGADTFDQRPGSLCWGELGTHDVDRAGSFYTQVFPWDAEVTRMGETDYTTFKVGEANAAGMYRFPPEMARVPPHWLAYFAVADIDASTARARELGAEQICPATVAEGVGRFTILRDPQGANFAIIQLGAA